MALAPSSHWPLLPGAHSIGAGGTGGGALRAGEGGHWLTAPAAAAAPRGAVFRAELRGARLRPFKRGGGRRRGRDQAPRGGSGLARAEAAGDS